MKIMEIRGINIDKHGRCLHYRSERDVVANRCATCREYWACHACHRALADHPFGRMAVDDPTSAMCGVCGHMMGYPTFNPGCAAHAPLYFEV